MTPAEAALVLTKCCAYDQRTIGKADAMAWAEVLADVARDDAMHAVVTWYRDHRERVMPSDIRAIVKSIRDDRIRNGPSEGEMMRGVDPNVSGAEWNRIRRERIAIVAAGKPLTHLRSVSGGVA